MNKKEKVLKEIRTTIYAAVIGIIVGSIIALGIIWWFEAQPEGFITEQECNEYIIDNQDDLKFNRELWYIDQIDGYDSIMALCYRVDTCCLPYWDDLTIKDYGDSAYIIFWGDRYSWKWDLKLDKGYWIYRDNEIYDILDSICVSDTTQMDM